MIHDEYHNIGKVLTYGLVRINDRKYVKCSQRCCNGKSKRQEERERQEVEE